MRLLLDTHVVLWQFGAVRRPSRAAREAIEQATDRLLSVVSFAEVGIKAATGKLRVPEIFHERVLRSHLNILQLDAEHGLALADLPMHHRDPFDRLLIAQARAERLAIVTADRRFAAYDVPVIDAG